MDFQLQSNDGHKPSKRGVHGCWKNFDQKYMHKWFGGPVDHHAAARQAQQTGSSSGLAAHDGQMEEMSSAGYTPPLLDATDEKTEAIDNFESVDLGDADELL